MIFKFLQTFQLIWITSIFCHLLQKFYDFLEDLIFLLYLFVSLLVKQPVLTVCKLSLLSKSKEVYMSHYLPERYSYFLCINKVLSVLVFLQLKFRTYSTVSLNLKALKLSLLFKKVKDLIFSSVLINKISLKHLETNLASRNSR